MSKVKVIISNEQNVFRIPTGVRMLVRRCCKAVLEMEEFNEAAEISVTFVDDEEIRNIVIEEETSENTVCKLVDVAKESGGLDNITVICIRFK